VEVVRERNVDGLDLVVRQQLVIGAVGARDLPLPCVGLGPPGLAAGHAEERDTLGGVRRRDHKPVDVRRREDAPPDGLAHR
jgi:hypothetical protein